MKRRILPWLLVLACVFCLCLGLTACDDVDIYSVSVESGEGYVVEGISSKGYEKGDIVTFTVKVTASDKQINQVKADVQVLQAQADGHYEFVMPAKNVVISIELGDKLPVLSASSTNVVLNVRDTDNNSAEITVTVDPASDSHELNFVAANPNIATVVADGNSATITAVAKGETTVTVSLKNLQGATPLTINVSVKDYRPWTAEEIAAMQEHLYGIVLEPTSHDDMIAHWDEKAGQITVEGGYAEGADLFDYASLYTADNGWVDITGHYGVEEGTAYIFEKGVSTADGMRYVRVHIYATDEGHGGDLLDEGPFYITAWDPYVYEWPEADLLKVVGLYLSVREIPAIEAGRYQLIGSGVAAYYESNEVDGGYSAILREAGYVVTEIETGLYRAVSPDQMYCLMYAYGDGVLEILITRPLLSVWPANAIDTAFEYYAYKGAEKYDVPAFEGDDVSFTFSDYEFNSSSLTDTLQLHGTVIVLDSTQALTDAYIAKLLEAGWVLADESAGNYILTVGDKVGMISVNFYEDSNKTEIVIYYALREDPTKGWNAAEVAKLTKYVNDIIPAYTGTIISLEVTSDSVYIKVPEEDFATLEETYIQILYSAGYTLTGTSQWTYKYHSPNDEFTLSLSTPSSRENTLCLYYVENNTAWNEVRIKDLLEALGSDLQSIPAYSSSKEFVCSYASTATLVTIRVYNKDSSSLTNDDLDAYKAILVADGWSLAEGSSTKYVKEGCATAVFVDLYLSTVRIRMQLITA